MDVSAPPDSVVWHDLECGGYTADLALWLRLAARARERHGPDAAVLELGAGTGRVALALARAGHRVTAVEIEPELAAALEERAAGLPVTVLCADARQVPAETELHGLCLVPMQTLQLMLAARERLALLDAARAQLLPGARLACAIVTDFEHFEGHELAPEPEVLETPGGRFSSRAVRVAPEGATIVLEREREIRSGGEARRSREVLQLAALTPTRVEEEAQAVGLTPAGREQVASTEEHSGSTVVMFDA